MVWEKVVLHIHGGGFKEYYATNPQWIASILNRCDAIITLSESWKEFYQSVTEGVDIYIVENIVALPVEKVVKKQDNKFHLLFLGLVDKQKVYSICWMYCMNMSMSFKAKLCCTLVGTDK